MGVDRSIREDGDGATYPKAGDTVVMSYVGTLANGKKFDSNTKFECKIGVGKVIKGWDEGVVQMSLGEKAVLTISPDYGYGKDGYPPVIPGNSVLVFEVQLLEIKRKK